MNISASTYEYIVLIGYIYIDVRYIHIYVAYISMHRSRRVAYMYIKRQICSAKVTYI